MTPQRVQDARKETIDGAHALTVLEGVDELYVTKGKQVMRFDLKRARPDDETLRGLLCGPTGNLRAPSVRARRRLVVGFDPHTYDALVKGAPLP